MLIGAGAAILGNVVVGTGAQIVAGSLVLKPVEAHTMVAGSPARCVGHVRGNPALQMEQWNTLVFEGSRAAQLLASAPASAPGPAPAESAARGEVDASAPTPPAPAAPPAVPGRPLSGAGRVANGVDVRRPANDASVRANRGVLDSIQAAESRGRHARIEKNRELIRNPCLPNKPPAPRAAAPPVPPPRQAPPPPAPVAVPKTHVVDLEPALPHSGELELPRTDEQMYYDI